MIVSTTLVAIWSIFILQQNVEALTCLKCDYMVQPRYCKTVISCPDDDSCFVERQTSTFGEEVYNLGCIAKRSCRNSTTSSSHCTQCCDKDLCNHAGCGEEGYPVQRGPVCYSCDNPTPEGRCHSIDVCPEEEVCSLNGEDMFGTIVFTTGCTPKDHCVAHPGSVLIGRRSQVKSILTRSHDLHDCFHCCDDDLCNKQCQAKDGQWGSWTTWSLCTSICNQTRTRACDNPAPLHGGKDCPGLTTQTQGCYTDQCQMDGQWGAWTAWSLCTSHCNQTRTRACDNPAPLHGGRDCPGLTMQTQGCYTDQCQITDCSALISRGASRLSGVYNITTPVTHTKKEVFCDMETDGGGWTVFQRRFDGSVNFYRNFRDYENRFGFVNAEHWLGLKYIHEMASRGANLLRLDIVRSNGSNGFDVYGNFSLGPGTKYTLHIGSRLRFSDCKSLFEDAYGIPDGNSFSTYDHDTDIYPGNCAENYHGAWWYNHCFTLNPNGLYQPGNACSDTMRYETEVGLKAITIMFKPV